ncbi:hypothetical protein BOTCAL_0108g00170 [Botryotinia calthae]|uniref:Uncharacterized protein n=1 Tax=Botryotinia calthae TaxID=38488 RepID=A0A4Y8D7X6_9HELO|nr:hypothetical protein BOTCAL_0108g00170 [Botryotinia calthae]
MASEDHGKIHTEDLSGHIAHQDRGEKAYHCPLCLGSGRIPRRMNNIAERSVASVDGKIPEQRKSEVRAIELLWTTLNDEEKCEFEQKREDEKRKTSDAIKATPQSVVSESKGPGNEKARRESRVNKFVRASASQGNELKDEKKKGLKSMNKSMDEATFGEDELDNHQHRILSERMKQVAENAAKLQKLRDEDQGLEERANQIMETDGAEGLEELEVMNKFYEHQINRLQNMNGRKMERKEFGERVNRDIDVDFEGGRELKDSHQSDDHKTKKLEDEERNNMGRVESLVNHKKIIEDIEKGNS